MVPSRKSSDAPQLQEEPPVADPILEDLKRVIQSNAPHAYARFCELCEQAAKTPPSNR